MGVSPFKGIATQVGHVAPQAPGDRQHGWPFWIVVGPPKQEGPGGLTCACVGKYNVKNNTVNKALENFFIFKNW